MYQKSLLWKKKLKVPPIDRARKALQLSGAISRKMHKVAIIKNQYGLPHRPRKKSPRCNRPRKASKEVDPRYLIPVRPER
jgi:hypothetical protein